MAKPIEETPIYKKLFIKLMLINEYEIINKYIFINQKTKL